MAVDAIEAELAKALQAGHGLSLSEFRALHALALAPQQELRMQDLAAQIQLNQSSVSRMVERLERAGLTLRDLCPDDKRGVYTVLTDKGRAHVKQAGSSYDAMLEEAISRRGFDALLLSRVKQT